MPYNAVDLVNTMNSSLTRQEEPAEGSLRSRIVVTLALAEVTALWGTIVALLA